jgi:hypothetical protein
VGFGAGLRERPGAESGLTGPDARLAVMSALGEAAEPLRVREICVAVEELLGERVPYSTVKDALSAHSGRADHRFRRTRRGRYELS